MALTRKDAVATVLTALAVLVYLASAGSWNVPLVGGSVRWAAVVVFVLGQSTCALGSPSRGASRWVLGALGAVTLGIAVIAIVTASEAALALLVAAIVVLWIASTARHAAYPTHPPVATR
jgi:hypothetical protein